MPTIQLPRDVRWGELGEGLTNLVGSLTQAWQQRRVQEGVAQIDQDQTIPDEQKYGNALQKYGEKGAALYNNLQRAKVIQQQLQDIRAEHEASTGAWSALTGVAPGEPAPLQPPPSVSARAALGLPPSDQSVGEPAIERGATTALPGRVDPQLASIAPVVPFPAQEGTIARDPDVPMGRAPAGTAPYTPAPKPPRAGTAAAEPPEGKRTMGFAEASGQRFDKTKVRAGDIAEDALQNMPAAQVGKVSIRQLAQAIEAANPNASSYVKMLALERASKVLAPEEKMQWEIQKANMNADLRVGLAQMAAQRAVDIAELKGDIAGQKPTFFQQGEDIIAVRPGTGPGRETVSKVAGAEGATRVGGPGTTGTLTDAQAEYWAQYVSKVGNLPVALGRNSADRSKILKAASGLGIDPGTMAANIGGYKADTGSLRRATALADAATGYEETALKNLDVATQELHKNAPTGFGPWLNHWATTGEMQWGDKRPPGTVAAVLTFANEYAKVMSGATGAQAATVSSRLEAEQLFSPYFNAKQWDEAARIARTDMANRKAALWENVDDIKARIGETGAGRSATEQMGAGPGRDRGRDRPTGGTDWSKKSDEEILKELGIR